MQSSKIDVIDLTEPDSADFDCLAALELELVLMKRRQKRPRDATTTESNAPKRARTGRWAMRKSPFGWLRQDPVLKSGGGPLLPIPNFRQIGETLITDTGVIFQDIQAPVNNIISNCGNFVLLKISKHT